MNRSRWHVITGAFSSGKTTLIQALADIGYSIVPEAARMLINEDIIAGKTIEEIRANEFLFEHRVMERKLQIEAFLPLDKMLFLDRAMPDSIAYHRLIGLDSQEVAKICQKGLYQKVFCLEPLSFTKDYARTESETAIAKLHQLLQDAYRYLDYDVVMVPPLPLQDRLDFVIKNL